MFRWIPGVKTRRTRVESGRNFKVRGSSEPSACQPEGTSFAADPPRLSDRSHDTTHSGCLLE